MKLFVKRILLQAIFLAGIPTMILSAANHREMSQSSRHSSPVVSHSGSSTSLSSMDSAVASELPPLKDGESPIDLKSRAGSTLIIDIITPQLMNYDKAFEFKIIEEHRDHGHGEIRFAVSDNNQTKPYMMVDGKRYDLVQFHFHAPSEHYLEGKAKKLEIHLVHKNSETNNLAVLGLLYEIGKESKHLKKIIDSAQRREGIAPKFIPSSFLPTNKNVFRYFGSLTTPPYTKNVNWQVFKTTKTVTIEQLNQLREQGILHSARNVQDINQRAIITSPN